MPNMESMCSYLGSKNGGIVVAVLLVVFLDTQDDELKAESVEFDASVSWVEYPSDAKIDMSLFKFKQLDYDLFMKLIIM